MYIRSIESTSHNCNTWMVMSLLLILPGTDLALMNIVILRGIACR